MERLRVLSIAVASGKIGYAYFVGCQLADWGTVRRASRSPRQAAKKVEEWIKLLRPDVVVTEAKQPETRKQARTWALIAAMQAAAANHPLLDVAVKREQKYANKFEEAKALAAQFPVVADRLPRPHKLWQTESRNTILFEAIAMGKTILDGPTPQLARALG